MNIYKKAIEHFTPEHQKLKAIEEMGELITLLGREASDRVNLNELTEEIADVENMMAQLKIIYDVEFEVESMKITKMKRLNERMDELEVAPESPDPCDGTLRDCLIRGEDMPPWLIELIEKRHDVGELFDGCLVRDLFGWVEAPEGHTFWFEVNAWQQMGGPLPEEPKA